MNIQFDSRIAEAAPDLEVIVVETPVTNPPTPDELWRELEAAAASVATCDITEIRHRPAIAATRDAYKALGKEPNRYRPSAEALCRRVVNGKGLYRTTTIVDIVNLVSLITGHSIGAFDADRIEGDTLTLGAGRHDEPYEAIGRGQLNIENLPVFRDAVGGIGTPTSDNVRTQLSADTRRLLVTINCYGQAEQGNELTVDLLCSLLHDYAGADPQMSITHHRP
ncbi:MAG: hypothetical protein K2L16_03255 [Muribaculaceae bacterium]|nr:hypothetical protein [Muribaculaceae bacterium]